MTKKLIVLLALTLSAYGVFRYETRTKEPEEFERYSREMIKIGNRIYIHEQRESRQIIDMDTIKQPVEIKKRYE